MQWPAKAKKTMLFRYCPKCSGGLAPFLDHGVRRRRCPSCGYVQYRNPTVGATVILLEDDCICLVRRSGSHKGAWCIPCGHVEWDEDISGAARREMLEETGLKVETGPVFRVLSNFHDPKHHTVGVWFMGRRISGQPRPGPDVSEVPLLPLSRLPRNMAFPTDGGCAPCCGQKKPDSHFLRLAAEGVFLSGWNAR